jgi:flagellin
MLSVNTNSGAMIALQYLSQTQAQMATTENAISTGLKVASAKDNGATYAIAQNMRGNVAGYAAVTDSLNRGMSAVDVATSAGQSISDLLIQMKQKALSASDTSLDTASRQAMNQDFTALRDQITTIVKNAVFNGFNLVDGSVTAGITALASADGSRRITVASQKMSLSGSIVTIKSTGTISTAAKASTMIATINASLQNVNAALAKLSSGSKKFSIQLDFVQKLSDTLTTGIGNLVDANMAQESALLTSLQTKQQLGIQALAIANQAPSSVLSLFK